MSKVQPLMKSDGSKYKLQKPNPLMKNQEFLSEETVIFHNMDKKSSEVEHESSAKIVEKKEDLPQKEIAEIKKLIVSESEIQQPIQEKKKIVESPIEVHEDITVYHCLPAILEEYLDELYGEKHITLKYGKKFLFEGVEVEDNGFQYSFNTVKEIPNGSVIYPSYRKLKQGTPLKKNWWKVSNVSHQGKFYLHQCVLSNINPDFS